MQGFFYGILGCEQSGNNSKYTTLCQITYVQHMYTNFVEFYY